MAVFTPEDLSLTPEQQAAYDAAFAALKQPSTFLAPIPKLVSVEDSSNFATTTSDPNNNNISNDTNTASTNQSFINPVATRNNNNTNNNDTEEAELMAMGVLPDEVVTLITPRRGHNELYRALEELEGLEKEEQSVLTKTDLTRVLTEIIMNPTSSSTEPSSSIVDSRAAVESLERLGRYVPRRVCQHPFRRNDIVWVCRTCQADETCVLCHACYSQSNHEGHDVAFYHAQAGGCCDCGDPDAWDPAGFCPRHGPNAIVTTTENEPSQTTILSPSLLLRVRGVVPAVVDWMVQYVATNAENAYARANPSKKKIIRKMKSQVERSTTTTNPQTSVPHRLLTFDHMDLEETKDDEDQEDDEGFYDDHDDDWDGSYPAEYLAASRHPHAFSPLAASSSLPDRNAMRFGGSIAAAEQLANVGRQGHGLFVVLHADDIHTPDQVREALRVFFGTANNYFPDRLLDKVVIGLRQYGQLVVFGTMELVAECGATQVHLWMDGDKIASVKIGGAILERAAKLTKRGLFCSIVTREELIIEQRAVAALQWLSVVARSCDPLCQTVAECILPNRHLVPLLLADFKMSARVTKAWYSLLLTLLAVPTFKSHLAAAYCDTYRAVTAKYARGMGVLERSGYTLSVQFLNRVTYVVNLVQGRDLLGKLGKSLLETLQVASRSQFSNGRLHLSGRLNPNHFVLTHRRYSPCISDLKCVLNVKGMSRVIACKGGTFLEDWVAALSLAQFMDPQTWQHWDHGHVEEESRGWVGAFNASISLGSLFERLLGWDDDEKSPIEDPSSPLSKDLRSCVELTFHILTNGLHKWQCTEMLSYVASDHPATLESFRKCPASLPFSTIAAAHGTALAMKQLPVSQSSAFSFHLPLHRFVSGCLRELCLRKIESNCDITALLQRLQTELKAEHRDELFLGLMEFPTLVLTRAAQVRANLWRRNGSGLNDQVLNYAEPPFCRNMRDADLLMVQFASIARTGHLSMTTRPSSDVGITFLIHLVIHRLGIFDFMGLAKAPDGNLNRYLEEIAGDLYPSEKRYPDVDGDVILPWTYSPARDSTSAMLLLEEFLHFIIMFISELPPPVPVDKDEQMRQAKYRLYREVIHRLASGPKTHSELSEVHHVLSHWDNVLLSEEGKLINPDDATGAALGTVLTEIADRKVSKGKMEPDKWEMKRSAWGSYDPAFFHINLRNHQTAAEWRPKATYDASAPFGWRSQPYSNSLPHQPESLENPSSQFAWHSIPYAPILPPAHPFFERLRRDVTSDAVVLSIAYKVLHLHCRSNLEKDLYNLNGKIPYENKEKSETSLARTIHLITLGAYAWRNARDDDTNWRDSGGGSLGSVFFDFDKPPTAACWIRSFLLAEPHKLLACDWYLGEEKALTLLHRLAVNGGSAGGFMAQDPTVRSGAAWLCEYALSFCPDSSEVIRPSQKSPVDFSVAESVETEAERRKKLAKQRKEEALARMKAQAAKFACMMEVDLGSDEETEKIQVSATPMTPRQPIRHESFGSSQTDQSSASSTVMVGTTESGGLQPYLSMQEDHGDEIPPRLLQRRPRCIICNDEDVNDNTRQNMAEGSDGDVDGQRKKSRRRTENALAFVGYAQASTVLKGGGGPPPDLASPMYNVSEFVGTYVALCGHAVHSECCESYLATVSHREERQIGKRDEFRCPLCQRLSNCLVPFIDVGVDWIESPSCCASTLLDSASSSIDSKRSGDDMQIDSLQEKASSRKSIHDFLESTSWWVARDESNLVWDGHSAFVEKSNISTNIAPHEDAVTRKPSRKIRSIKKKDLYAAWNVMMRTPRFVSRRLRRSCNRSDSMEKEETASSSSGGEDSIGETVVWRRFMDTICDISYRADSKRLGEERFSRDDLFGEFRHYIREKYAYNLTNRFIGNEPADWPVCMFNETLSDGRRQEMSREKLLSKLLLTIQSFAYSCCCAAFEAKRLHQKCVAVARKNDDSNIETVLSRFGISGVVCDGKMILLPRPSSVEDSGQHDGGSWPFDGRLGKLRYFGLTVMAAAGAIAADLTQLVVSLPHQPRELDPLVVSDEFPERSPIAYPILFGNVLAHITAALCAVCGRARARSDSLELSGPVSHCGDGKMSVVRVVDSVVEDCEGFMKLGLLARVLQVLLGKLDISPLVVDSRPILMNLQALVNSFGNLSTSEASFMQTCVRLLQIALASRSRSASPSTLASSQFSIEQFREACDLAASAATSLLVDMGTIMQILVPGIVLKYENAGNSSCDDATVSNFLSFERMICHFNFEPLDLMLQSPLTQQVIAFWFDEASSFSKKSVSEDDAQASLRNLLYHSQGFRVFDWPKPGILDIDDTGRNVYYKDSSKSNYASEPEDNAHPTHVSMERIHSGVRQASTADVLRKEASPSMVSFISKKTVSLLGGYTAAFMHGKASTRPRVLALPTSYTDLYAELGSLLPDCEQTAVCLICGEVLNAGGKSECTHHSYKCGAGAGVFFLLQECSGLIMHKSKAAYIQSPYVDSHGETPQFRGRPLNLDMDRYELLREVWFSHEVRQKVVAERGSSRQIILPDFY